MLALNYIRENLDAVERNCKNRGVKVDLGRLMTLDEKRRKLIGEVEDIRRQQNDTATLMQGKLDKDEREKFIAMGKDLKLQAQKVDEDLRAVQHELDSILCQVPNMTSPSSPVDLSEDGSLEISKWGEPTKFSFKPKDHVELGSELGLIDFESAAKVTGQKFYYLKRDAVLLEQALVNYAVSLLRADGFVPVITPDLARASILDGIGFNPRGAETQIYSVEDSDLCLIATAEITLGGMLSDTIIDGDDLPLKYVGLSHCFRTEAGAAGKESKGLYRVHQFTKVEMFAFTLPENSEAMHDEFLKHEEKIFQGLGVPYRVMDICTGDLGGPAYRKFDLEAWMPGRGESGDWGEVTSTSNCTDYQSRRLKIRYKKKGEKKPQLVHMTNGTAIATSRALIAILENYQQADGSIVVPEILRPYMGGIKKIVKSEK